MSGTAGDNWLPNNFALDSGSNPAIYTENGIKCTSPGNCNYYAPISEQNNIIKVSLNFDGSPQNFLISCRASDFSNEERLILRSNGEADIEEFNSGNGGGLASSPYNYTSGKHTLEFDCNSNNLTFKEDGNTLAAATYNFPELNNSPFIFDRVRLLMWQNNWELLSYAFCDSQGCTTEQPPLSVPILKQTSDPWQSQEYDSAHLWAPNNPTIHDWGCALTSATMVLNFYGLTKMPDGTPVDPSTLNTWLNSQPDGYISNNNGNGLVNWAAIARLTKLLKLAFNNPNFTHDALVYKRINNADTTTLINDLQQNRPDILEEPNHFIVATGKTPTSFTINDPAFPRQTLDNGYNNTFAALIRFVPSNTDLSNIILVGDNHTDFTVTTASGTALGQQYTQNPLENDFVPGMLSGSPLHMFTIEEPSDSTYHITVHSSASTYSFTGYLYDIDGKVKKITVTGLTGNNGTDSATITFDKQNKSNDTLERTITFQTFINDLNKLYGQHDVAKGPYNSILALAKDAQKNNQKHQNFLTGINLKISLFLLNVFHTRGVDQIAFSILQEDIQQLLGTL